MKKYIFLTTTNFHVMVAASLILEKYNPENGIESQIIQLNRSGKEGLADLDTNALPAFIERWCFNEFEIKTDVSLQKKIKDLQAEEIDTLVLFLEQAALSVYFAHHFKQKGTRIVLAPDGNKPYYKVVRKALKSRFFETVRIQRFIRKQAFKIPLSYFLSWNYARLAPVDEVWIRFPDAFENVMHKVVTPFTMLPSTEIIKAVNQLFNYDLNQSNLPTENVIYYVNNILYEAPIYAAEIQALQEIRARFPKVPLMIKYHPATPTYQLAKFKAIEGTIIIDSLVPVELMIANLKNSIVLSMWSAALMQNNAACNFYWLTKYLEKNNRMLQRINLENPTLHIKEEADINNVNFPQSI